MSLDRVLWITLLGAFIILFAVHFLHLQSPISSSISLQHSPHSSLSRGGNSESINKLIELIRIQNETIFTLENKLNSATHLVSSPVTKDIPLPLLNKEISKTVTNLQSVSNAEIVPKARQECEAKYGMDLASIWKKNGEVWCEDKGNSDPALKSELKCYPYHQAHKKLDGRGPDLICEATNFVIDFTKVSYLPRSFQCFFPLFIIIQLKQVSGAHSSHKPPLGDQYLGFGEGSLLSPCSRTSKFNPRLFMPHHALQVRIFIIEPVFVHIFIFSLSLNSSFPSKNKTNNR
jgi:hypothetical protein